MFNDEQRKIIEHIVRGTLINTTEDTCTAARNLLCASFSTSTSPKTDFEGQLIFKKEQEQQLVKFATDNGLWLNGIPSDSTYLTRGGESKVYLKTDNRYVIKVNDAVYYATWLDYLNSLLLHNVLFPVTRYELLGLLKESEQLFLVLEQPYIMSEGLASLDDIKTILQVNGFQNTRRQDYFNPQLGLILEDMHDENVIMNGGAPFFIDTVFYIDLNLKVPKI
ncbi:MAG: hypothetical protein ABW036_00230 [Flavitalea sp.]